jgi:hypothetical protein
MRESGYLKLGMLHGHCFPFFGSQRYYFSLSKIAEIGGFSGKSSQIAKKQGLILTVYLTFIIKF